MKIRPIIEEQKEIYVCQSCGYEDHPDKFGKYCPKCGADLDELETVLNSNKEEED